MAEDDRLRHWRQLADGYVESAATLYRKNNYGQTFRHCYLAVQSALEATFIARRAYRVPSTVSLVVMADALGGGWNVAHKELFVGLTEWYRDAVKNAQRAGGGFVSREECLRTLLATAELVTELRDAGE